MAMEGQPQEQVQQTENGDFETLPAATSTSIITSEADNNINSNANVDEMQNGAASFVDQTALQTQTQLESVETSEEDRLWSIVTKNSADFTSWTSLIQETEKTDNLAKICKVYDGFLVEFPLCYGYWKRYADHEERLGSFDKVAEVYERAVQAVTYSVDIWVHYCTFQMKMFADADVTRKLFERGLSYVRMDYLSYLLWDKYIEFEYSQQEWRRLAEIYTRILQFPIQQLDRFYESFKQFATSQPLVELQKSDEISSVAGAAPIDAYGEGCEVTADGEAVKPEVLSEKEELEKYLAIREEMYKQAKELDAKIHDFEAAIRRPYFHVKPLDDVQLVNWHRYLDFIEKEADVDKIVKLYERCLIACASYPEYWIRYTQCMEANGNMEVANNALLRATDLFVKGRPEIHIFAARFKEQNGDIDGARASFHILGELGPGLVEVVVKHANMEKRLGNIEGAMSIYERAIEREKGKEESCALPLLIIQYTRFLYQVAGNVNKASEVLAHSLELLPNSKPLIMAAIQFESISRSSKQLDFLDTIVDRAMKSDGSQSLSQRDKEEISSIFVEFVDFFGNIDAVKNAEAHQKQVLPVRKKIKVSRKRALAEASTSDKTKLLKTAAESPAQSNTHTDEQSQWAAGYGAQGYAQQPQTWQQVPPQQAPYTQPQQWNPGYDQQGAYSAYGTYANYGPQQQQPQTFAGYGQGYPSQQNYGQPASAYSAPQQQPPVQPGYYAGGYY